MVAVDSKKMFPVSLSHIVDIDYCVNATCENGASCVDGRKNYSCSCAVGFTGDLCETDMDDCISARCANGGTCVDGVNKFSCACQEGFTGEFCDGVVLERTKVPSSPTQEDSLTSKPPTEAVQHEGKTEFAFEIRLYEEWDDQLRDKTSIKFRELSALLEKEIVKAYIGISEWKKVEIISMRPDTTAVIVVFKMTFKEKVTVEEALGPLKTETADGKLGKLAVDPDSLRLKNTLKEDNEDEQHSTKTPLIIGSACGSIVLIAVFMVCLAFRHKRSAPSRCNSRVGNGVPPDEVFGKRERHEMKQTKPMTRKLIWMEEKGV